jgi:hypothetical protein
MKNKHKKETINLIVLLMFRTLKKHMMTKANLSNKIIWTLNSSTLIKVCFMRIKLALKQKVRLMGMKEVNFNL